MKAINLALRAACLFVFAMALAKGLGLVLPDSFGRAPLLAAVLLVLHTLELPFALKHLRADSSRPLWFSVVLTLLFGVLHWKPLADAARKP